MLVRRDALMKATKTFWTQYAVAVGLAVILGTLAVILKIYSLPGARILFIIAFLVMAFSVISVWFRMWKTLVKKNKS